MLFQDKMQALLALIIMRNGVVVEFPLLGEQPFDDLQKAGMLDSDYRLTDKGWETANRLANEFGEEFLK